VLGFDSASSVRNSGTSPRSSTGLAGTSPTISTAGAGYQRDRTDYEAALCEADVFVSTAEHEFFGLSAVEAALAGAYPLLPERLAYPEIFGREEDTGACAFFYDGSSADLADKLTEAGRRRLFSRLNTEPSAASPKIPVAPPGPGTRRGARASRLRSDPLTDRAQTVQFPRAGSRHYRSIGEM